MKITEITALLALIIILYLTAFLASQTSDNKTQNNTMQSRSNIKIPVINATGKARLLNCDITLTPGTGKLLIDITDSYIDDYTAQSAIKTALIAAEKQTGMSLDSYDTIISLGAGGATIKGDSLGAPVAVAIVAAIKNREIDPSMTITGTIHKDGTIGRVGNILEKAEASKEQGITTLLVPGGASVQAQYTEKKQCDESGTSCTSRIEKIETDISKEAGISIIETSDLQTAITHMLR